MGRNHTTIRLYENRKHHSATTIFFLCTLKYRKMISENAGEEVQTEVRWYLSKQSTTLGTTSKIQNKNHIINIQFCRTSNPGHKGFVLQDYEPWGHQLNTGATPSSTYTELLVTTTDWRTPSDRDRRWFTWYFHILSDHVQVASTIHYAQHKTMFPQNSEKKWNDSSESQRIQVMLLHIQEFKMTETKHS
jgi:hypothetical protein